MRPISRGAVKIRGFAIAGIVIGLSVIAAACSSASGPSEFPQADGGTDARPPTCVDPIALTNANVQTNTYSGGSCDSSSKDVSCSFQPTSPCAFEESPAIYTCTCDGANWTCSITGGGLGGGWCADGDASTDASSDADLDASAASDAADE